MLAKRLQLLFAILALAIAAPAALAPRVLADSVAASEPAAVVGLPPASGSDEAKADLAIVLWEQERRTAADVARAAAEETLTLAAWGEVLGDVDPATHPRTVALLAQAQKDAKAIADPLKKRFERPRPFLADQRVRPAIALETTGSFPSGHATRGVLFALLLAEVRPDLRDALLARGRLAGFDRVIGGVHYPSDVAAGQRLGQALFDQLRATPAYREGLAAARAEWPAPAR
jgi:acid phosphatase (class A)